MQNIRKKILSLVALMAFSMLMVPGIALAQCPAGRPPANAQESIACGVSSTGAEKVCTATPGGPPVSCLEQTIRQVINIITIVVGIVAVIMIIIGGLKYILSSGDSNNVNSAKNTILYAIVGLVIVALAQIIVRFVLGRIS